MGFDKRIIAKADGCKVEYGIVFGNGKIVFMKCGADGKIPGYGDKYLKMAQRAHNRLGATVICAGNPSECDSQKADEAVIKWCVKERKFTDYEVYLFGASDGAYQNLKLAKQIPQTVKLVGVNTSSNCFDRLVEKLRALSDIEKIFVYGTKDYEYKKVPSLKAANIDNFEIRTVEGATHRFAGMLDKYVVLADLL